jgi:hypothetical protein
MGHRYEAANVVPIRGRGEYHPALPTILWRHVDPHSEEANYCGHLLRVDHHWPDEHKFTGNIDYLVNVGFIDGVEVARTKGQPMQHICEQLFRLVDDKHRPKR